MIITVANQKGGTGKSVIAQNMAAYYAQKQSVLLIDGDQQGTCAGWYSVATDNDNASDNLSVIKAEGRAIYNMATQAQQDIVIVDLGGYDSRDMRAALSCTDMILSPVQPKHNDVTSFEDFLDIVPQIERQRKLKRGAIPVLCLFNMVQTHIAHRDAHEAKEFVYENMPRVHILDAVIHQRIDYDRLSGSGYTAFDSGNKQVHQQMKQALNEIDEYINENTQQKSA